MGSGGERDEHEGRGGRRSWRMCDGTIKESKKKSNRNDEGRIGMHRGGGKSEETRKKCGKKRKVRWK